MNPLNIDTKFEQEDFSGTSFGKVEMDNCRFESCNFSNSDLTQVEFNECEFINCNFSMAEIRDTAFRNVHFNQCKLIGIRFDLCKQFLLSFHFQSCELSYSSFFNLNLKDVVFRKCKLVEADFTEANLNKASFEGCHLSRATFSNTNLEGSDFSTAINYSIDPEINKISKAKFSMDSVLGLLDKYDIKVS